MSTVERTHGQAVDLVQGTLDLLILKAIAAAPCTDGRSRSASTSSRATCCASTRALYPALQRLEREGWITAEWGASDNNRRARFYSLTKAGRKHLEREQAGWERLSQAIALVLRTA